MMLMVFLGRFQCFFNDFLDFLMSFLRIWSGRGGHGQLKGGCAKGNLAAKNQNFSIFGFGKFEGQK